MTQTIGITGSPTGRRVAAAAPGPRACSVLIEPIKTEKQALIQIFRAWFDPITASHLSDHDLVPVGEHSAGGDQVGKQGHGGLA
jgi:hypothetical protein